MEISADGKAGCAVTVAVCDGLQQKVIFTPIG